MPPEFNLKSFFCLLIVRLSAESFINQFKSSHIWHNSFATNRKKKDFASKPRYITSLICLTKIICSRYVATASPPRSANFSRCKTHHRSTSARAPPPRHQTSWQAIAYPSEKRTTAFRLTKQKVNNSCCKMALWASLWSCCLILLSFVYSWTQRRCINGGSHCRNSLVGPTPLSHPFAHRRGFQ